MSSVPNVRQLSLTALTFITFSITCGGAFGLEQLVTDVGPGWAVLMLLLAPLLWSLPIALMTAELATMIPEEGGYYTWVRNALGPFWGVQVAWWSLAYSALNMAIWPVLFVSYLQFLLPSFAGAGDNVRWLVAVGVIITAMLVNLGGAKDVGRSSEWGSWFILGTFVLMVVVWGLRGPGIGHSLAVVSADLHTIRKEALLLGMSVAILNFSGWDSISTFASEVERPQRNYPLALGGALVLLVVAYVVPVLAGVGVTTDAAVWSSDPGAGWPLLAEKIGGRWLGILLATAGLMSTWGLFNSQLLYVSRLPYVMACDGWLPHSLARTREGTAVPVVSVVGFCTLIAVAARFSFSNLVIMMSLFYTAMLVLEFLALVILRRRAPQLPRPFRVPGGLTGLVYVCLAPIFVAAVMLVATLRDGHSYATQIALVVAYVLAGWALYLAYHRRARARSSALMKAM